MSTRTPTRTVEPDTTNPVAVAKRIGREYVEMDSFPTEGRETAQNAYRSIARTTIELFDQIPVDVVFQSDDPYSGYEDMRKSVMEQEGFLRIYAGHADAHPYMTETENLKFRAVHDWHGHLANDVDFTPSGEYMKWYHMRDQFDQHARRALLADVVGQVGAVHYLKDGFASDRFEQRAFKAPPRWADWMGQAVRAEGKYRF